MSGPLNAEESGELTRPSDDASTLLTFSSTTHLAADDAHNPLSGDGLDDGMHGGHGGGGNKGGLEEGIGGFFSSIGESLAMPFRRMGVRGGDEANDFDESDVGTVTSYTPEGFEEVVSYNTHAQWTLLDESAFVYSNSNYFAQPGDRTEQEAEPVRIGAAQDESDGPDGEPGLSELEALHGMSMLLLGDSGFNTLHRMLDRGGTFPADDGEARADNQGSKGGSTNIDKEHTNTATTSDYRNAGGLEVRVHRHKNVAADGTRCDPLPARLRLCLDEMGYDSLSFEITFDGASSHGEESPGDKLFVCRLDDVLDITFGASTPSFASHGKAVDCNKYASLLFETVAADVSATPLPTERDGEPGTSPTSSTMSAIATAFSSLDLELESLEEVEALVRCIYCLATGLWANKGYELRGYFDVDGQEKAEGGNANSESDVEDGNGQSEKGTARPRPIFKSRPLELSDSAAVMRVLQWQASHVTQLLRSAATVDATPGPAISAATIAGGCRRARESAQRFEDFRRDEQSQSSKESETAADIAGNGGVLFFPTDVSLALPKERSIERVRKALRGLTESWEKTAMTVLRLQGPIVLDDTRPQRVDDLVRGIFDVAAVLRRAAETEPAPAEAPSSSSSSSTSAEGATHAVAAAAGAAPLDDPELGIAFPVSSHQTQWRSIPLLSPVRTPETADAIPAALSEMSKPMQLNAAATEIRSLLQQQGSVPRLVRALNRQRTRNVDVGVAYPYIASILLSILNHCLETRQDVESVLNSMMLSQSFYRQASASDEDEDERTHGWRIGIKPGSGPQREFLKSALERHPLWHDNAFWRMALDICVEKQRRLGHQTLDRAALPSSPSPSSSSRGGDDDASQLKSQMPPPRPASPASPQSSPSPLAFLGILSDEEAARVRAAKEAVEETKKIIFSQLGGIVHSMLEFGLTALEVVAFVERVCDDHGLTQVQEHAVVAHVEAVAAARGEANFEQW